MRAGCHKYCRQSGAIIRQVLQDNVASDNLFDDEGNGLCRARVGTSEVRQSEIILRFQVQKLIRQRLLPHSQQSPNHGYHLDIYLPPISHYFLSSLISQKWDWAAAGSLLPHVMWVEFRHQLLCFAVTAVTFTVCASSPVADPFYPSFHFNSLLHFDRPPSLYSTRPNRLYFKNPAASYSPARVSSIYYLPTKYVSNARPEKIMWRKPQKPEKQRVVWSAQPPRPEPRFQPKIKKQKDGAILNLPLRHTSNGRTSKVFILNKKSLRKKINRH